MTTSRRSTIAFLGLVSLAAAGVGAASTTRARPRGAGPQRADTAWTTRFTFEPGELGPTGRNPYFVLEPGHQLVLEGGRTRLVITVLAETRRVDGVETRVVEERETEGGRVVEVSRNFFAISARTNSVFYFGEDVDTYRDGRVAGHEGAWRAGAAGARAGLMMPGLPLVGARFHQEIAPGVAMDRAEIRDVDGELATPAGRFRGVLTIEETTPLEPDARETKRFAPGVGLVQDGPLLLVRHGPSRTGG
jgi:hypothetical protein